MVALVICPRCETLLKIEKVSETFFCRCGVELEHPDKPQGQISQNYDGQNLPRSKSGRRSLAASKRRPNPPGNNHRASNNNNNNGNVQIPSVSTSGSDFSTSSNEETTDTFNFMESIGSTGMENEQTHVEGRRQGTNLDDPEPAVVSIIPPPNFSANQNGNMHTLHERNFSAPYHARTNEGSDSSGSDSVFDRINEETSNLNISRANTSVNFEFKSTLHKRSSTTSESNSNSREEKICYTCKNKFTLLGKWKRTCKSCGNLVCHECSRGKWPAAMLPKEKNFRNERSLRVCNLCQKRTEDFRTSLIEGNLSKAKNLYENGVVHLTCPYQIYPHKLFPIHCAAISGNLDSVKWLISLGCSTRVLDNRNFSCLTLAAVYNHFEIVKHLIFNKLNRLDEITDVNILHKLLQTCFISLHQVHIKNSLDSYIANQESDGQSDLFAKTEEEEQEQINLALKMSQMGSDKPLNDANDTQNVKGTVKKEECVVCFENVVDCVLVPCGHMACCTGCGQKFDECPVCRQKIKQVVKTFRT